MSYATHHKRPKVFGPAYRKGYRLAGNLWGLVVGEDRWDYHSYLSSTLWIIWRWKIRQPTYSRDKSPAGLLLTGWQTLRCLEGRRRNSEASLAYIYPCLNSLAPLMTEMRDSRETLAGFLGDQIFNSTSDKRKSTVRNLHQPSRYQLSLSYLSPSNLTHLWCLVTLSPPDV